MAQQLQFQSIEKRHSGVLAWLVAVVVVVGVVGAVAWGLTRSSASDSVVRELASARAQVEELRSTLAERERLLSAAHEEADLLRSPGQAMGIFYRAAPDSTESGVVVAVPARQGARLYLYGLVAPPGSGEYVAVARATDGNRKVLGRMLPDDLGSGFLLSRDVPSGTVAVEVALRPPGREPVEERDIRVSARYPVGTDERGVLVQEPVQARSGKKR